MNDLYSTQHMPETVDAGSADFEEAVRQAGVRLKKREGTSFIFAGASKVQCQQALVSMMGDSSLNVYQFTLPNLISERYVETQGNLRKVFDKADEDAAMLVFDEVDALFAPTEYEGEPADGERTPVDYLFDRVDAFTGVVVLCMGSAEHVAAARARGADVVVAFER